MSLILYLDPSEILTKYDCLIEETFQMKYWPNFVWNRCLGDQQPDQGLRIFVSVVHYSQSSQENLGTVKVLVTEGTCGTWINILQKLKKSCSSRGKSSSLFFWLSLLKPANANKSDQRPEIERLVWVQVPTLTQAQTRDSLSQIGVENAERSATPLNSSFHNTSGGSTNTAIAYAKFFFVGPPKRKRSKLE